MKDVKRLMALKVAPFRGVVRVVAVAVVAVGP